MDYQRIYREFIESRKAIESNLTGYVEKHHIVPRALGGGDEQSNLIRLTPEDHFFGHLLLAKIHGGSMWAPVAFMVGGSRKNWSACKSRRAYGWATRAMANALRGEGAHQFDHTVYRIEHADGRKWQGTQSSMNSEIGLSRSIANMLVKRRVGSAHGWFLEGERPAAIGRGAHCRVAHPMERKEVHDFRHVDGRSFKGTQRQLTDVHSVSKPCACRLARGQQRVAGGWYIAGRPPHTIGRGAKLHGSSRQPG